MKFRKGGYVRRKETEDTGALSGLKFKARLNDFSRAGLRFKVGFEVKR
jgi:hypothetical protein